MGGDYLKNWTPKEVVKFLQSQGYLVLPKRGKGDHAVLFNPQTKGRAIVDMGHSNFYQSEMKGFVKSTNIPAKLWKK